MNDEKLLKEILDLAVQLVAIPTITVGSPPRLAELQRAADLIVNYLEENGIDVRRFNQGDFPAILASFPGQATAPVMLSGHFDVVTPEPDGTQFRAYREGDYLFGRGTGDMKTVVATFMVWMKEQVRLGPPYPPFNLLLVSNEERGEDAPMGTPFVLEILAREGYTPKFFIAGERTEERGQSVWGKICTENRGVMRLRLIANGERAHSGSGERIQDVTGILLQATQEISALFYEHMTTKAEDNWRSELRFPFLLTGDPDVYNITAETGLLGLEIRAIPQDDLAHFFGLLQGLCADHDLIMEDVVVHPGIACNLNNPYLAILRRAVARVSGQEAGLGRKWAGTSARFAPGGQGVVWGQSGLEPHSAQERHYIPSIMPYFRALTAYAELLMVEEALG